MENIKQNLKRYEICLTRPHKITLEQENTEQFFGLVGAIEKVVFITTLMSYAELLGRTKATLEVPKNVEVEILSIIQITEENREKLGESAREILDSKEGNS